MLVVVICDAVAIVCVLGRNQEVLYHHHQDPAPHSPASRISSAEPALFRFILTIQIPLEQGCGIFGRFCMHPVSSTFDSGQQMIGKVLGNGRDVRMSYKT